MHEGTGNPRFSVIPALSPHSLVGELQGSTEQEIFSLYGVYDLLIALDDTHI